MHKISNLTQGRPAARRRRQRGRGAPGDGRCLRRLLHARGGLDRVSGHLIELVVITDFNIRRFVRQEAD